MRIFIEVIGIEMFGLGPNEANRVIVESIIINQILFLRCHTNIFNG